MYKFLSTIAFLAFLFLGLLLVDYYSPVISNALEIPEFKITVVDIILQPKPIIIPKPIIVEDTVEVSAYNVGVEAQTDNSPCIGAYGHDLCQIMNEGLQNPAASNFLPVNTRVKMTCFWSDGSGFTVPVTILDRMNSRYQHHIDIALGPDKIPEALEFGRRDCEIEYELNN